MKIQLIRSASLRIVYDGKEIWVDPMFAEAGAYPPIPNTANPRNNPLVDIPLELDLLPTPDAIMLTHGHPDHFDTAAAERIPKDTPFFCQPEDRDTLVGQGFTNVSPIEDAAEWNGIRMYRTGGRHGTGVIGEQMGPVSGFVLRSELEPTLYLAGDTIWCEETEEAVRRFDPSVMVCYAGDACFLEGGPIIMNKEDVERAALAAPRTRLLVAHLEAWNHCALSREELKRYLQERQLLARVDIPADGEEIDYPMNEPMDAK